MTSMTSSSSSPSLSRTFVLRALLCCVVCSLATASHSPAFGMVFDPSSLISESSSSMPMGVAFPVAIQLVDSEGALDTTHSGTVITASIAAPSSLSGNVATVRNGVATFMLTITSCSGGAITFTAQDPANNKAAVSGKQLVSGAIAVQAVHNSDILFDGASPVQAGKAATIVRGAALQPLKINMYDSCGSLDTTMTGLSITVTASVGILGGETTATFTNGAAIFSNVHFVDAPTAASVLTFRVGATPNTAAANREVSTGAITVVANDDGNTNGANPASTGDGVFVVSRVALVTVVALVGAMLTATALYFCCRRTAAPVKYVEVAATYV